ncbi:MAG: phosphoesterase [Chlamydiae bacterium]|nr:phosphoesterase [Chlamydiota bacterium]
MTVWALSDPHLSFGAQNKSMEIFGPAWKDWTKKIETHWKNTVDAGDLVLVAGDISWAKNLEEALPDLMWLHALPGTKLLLKGNHDYWWPSMKKLQENLPSSIHCLYNSAFHWKDTTIGGTRLWDSPEYDFHSIASKTTDSLEKEASSPEEAKKIFDRELVRLKRSLDLLDKKAKYRLVMTHYPPIGLDLQPSQVSQILDTYNIDACIFGHLHSLNTKGPLFGKLHKTTYLLTSCDYLDFTPTKISLGT